MRKLALSDEILLSIQQPARYIGGEINSVCKDPSSVDVRFAMCFPDVYDIGMSHLGIQILYDMLNKMPDVYCERVYSPWTDLDAIMREKHIPLFAIESQDPVKDFDILGITLQYEMCYTNILQILDLSGIPLHGSDRTWDDPIVIGGGPCAYNPEPIAEFFDLFYIGEGETAYRQLIDIYKDSRKNGESRETFLKRAAGVPGIYVPSLYEPEYHEDGTLKAFRPTCPEAPEKVVKQLVLDMTEAVYPEKPLVPFIKVTQDRVVLEIMRGCIRGCRFCQAGMIYRPVREKNVERLKDLAYKMLKNTGHEEISLSSLSSSDYRSMEELVRFLIEEFHGKGVNVSLPSLRIDAFSLDVMSKVQDVKKSSLTFAPEAGSQRLRDVINKGLTEEEILQGAADAFKGGWNRVKLYFMLGLPTETVEDMEGIALLSEKIAEEYYEIPKDQRNGKVQVVASTSFFVPKPFTPFQWEPQDTIEMLHQKQRHLKESVTSRKIKVSCHDVQTSFLEGVFARGDRRLGKVLECAWRKGCKFDSWDDQFHFDLWEEAFQECGIDPLFYTNRRRSFDEVLPWDHMDYGIRKEFLMRENEKAHQSMTTPNCREQCAGCGTNRLNGGKCDALC